MNKSASGAKKYYSEEYYSEGKSLDSYYSENDNTIGKWGGKAAERLGLTGDISSKDFAALCDNINPNTGERLTLRKDNDATVGYDFTFNASKSVSLALTFGDEVQKKSIFKNFNDSVDETMKEIESDMLTRVRAKGSNYDRQTGNIAYGDFTHFTTRPIDGVPDMHLHKHCFVFNLTYDDAENNCKAGQFRQIKQDAPYYEAIFHSKFADKLQQAGFEIERTKDGFELKGISKETRDKFSLRTKEIEEVATENNITDAKQKSGIGAKTREGKRDMIDSEKIFANWQARLTDLELESIRNLKDQVKDGYEIQRATGEKKNDKAIYDKSNEAIEYSLKHHLERKSVATDKEILTTAIKSSIGETSSERIKEAFKTNTGVISVKEDNRTFITTQEALQEENKLIKNANDFKGRFKPLNENYQIKNLALSGEQKNAVNTALTSTDGITVIAGKAGTGKTTLMKEIQQGIGETNKNIFAFAPSAEASRMVQRKEGFENAETVALLIQNKEMQGKMKDSVIWIDEAGMLSNKDMNKILSIAKEQNARLILTGDTKQHSSVERGDALRIIQQEAGYSPITINKIRRQKHTGYKEAVNHLSKGDSEKGFNKLNKIGAIHEMTDHQERISNIAEDYFKSSFRGKKTRKEVLVVSPTHIEGEKITEAIRDKLKEKNVLSATEREFLSLRNLQLTAAEKEKAESYKTGDYLVFHQNVKGIKAGSKLQITAINGSNINLKDSSGRESQVDINNSSSYNVFSSKSIKLAEGDKIRITGNGKAKEGVHLFNGTLYNVKGFDKQGNIKLSNGTTLDKDYASLSHGYVMTSHASQGKTVDKVIISQSSMSFRASSQEQFYVSVSRGREAVSIYTDDKEDLLKAVSRSSERKSANVLVAANQNHAIEIHRLEVFSRMKEKAISATQRLKNAVNKIKEHEPNKSNGVSRTISPDKGKGR